MAVTYLGNMSPAPVDTAYPMPRSLVSNLVTFYPSIVCGLGGWRIRTYWMRGVNSLSQTVEWKAGIADYSASEYTGGNTPLTNIVVIGTNL